MKKIIIILVVFMLFLIGIGFGCMYVYHDLIISSSPIMEGWVLETDKYTVVPVIDENVSFYVCNKVGETVWSCDRTWRKWDFKSINIDKLYTITVDSADMGEEIYVFSDGIWISKE